MRKLAFFVLLGVGFALAGDADHGPKPSDDPRFEFLKRLEGSWTGESPVDGSPGGIFEFHVTAGGHAVEEREMVGTPMEMVTLYYMRGKQLVATHYCMLGNQPELEASRKVVDDTLAFTCNGTPGNASSHDDAHVHGWSMRIDDEGRLVYDAELHEGGKVSEAPSVILTRQQETASR